MHHGQSLRQLVHQPELQPATTGGSPAPLWREMAQELIAPPRGRGSRLFRDEEWYVLVKRLGLSRREAEIVRLVFDALSEPEIARRLDLAPPTIHTYLGRLYRKVGVKSRGELMTLVFFEFLEGRVSHGPHASP